MDENRRQSETKLCVGRVDSLSAVCSSKIEGGDFVHEPENRRTNFEKRPNLQKCERRHKKNCLQRVFDKGV